MENFSLLKGRLHDVLYVLRFDLRVKDPLWKYRDQGTYLAKTLASALGNAGPLMLLFQFGDDGKSCFGNGLQKLFIDLHGTVYKASGACTHNDPPGDRCLCCLEVFRYLIQSCLHQIHRVPPLL